MCKTYAEAFWGGDISSCAGYEALVKRNYDSKKMCQELEEYLKKRAKLEADYSKNLQNLAKCFRQREEVGVLEKAINRFRTEIEAVAQSHASAATIFQQQSDNVRKFKENQTAQRKAVCSN
ncbi:unnamed protein product [Candidula unifasciata]|uniref:F-BAR domain-containing protein n=1 Tax=Candidula unifasciata TaxID=100452 RepID=A0A8S3YMV3_9EUPU|nr:unnamed protein product [Candidula unifasciata]